MAGDKPTILVQLDTDPHPSVFDSVVAVDAGVDHLFRLGGVTPENVRGLVHGALFTRGPGDLRRTALFVGGSDVAAGEAVLAAVKATFFAGFRVSVLLDPNGCNTTAAAAVAEILKSEVAHSGRLDGVPAAVLGATGPVGQRVARLLARCGAEVSVGSRRLDRARDTAALLHRVTGADFRTFATADRDDLLRGLDGAQIVVSAGAAGTTLLPEAVRRTLSNVKVLVDLNAVPPAGIEGVKAPDRAAERDGARAWGAIGVGGTKMKIHKQAIRELFSANDAVIDAEEALAIGRALE